mgnify:FL=1|jgi:AraC-like DNA-binding protein
MDTKNILDIVQRYLKKRERYILLSYRFLNKEIMSFNYEINNYEMKVFFEYFKNNDEEVLGKIWRKNAIPKDIFLFSVLTYEFFSNNIDGNIEEYLRDKGFDSLISKLLMEYFSELKDMFMKISDLKLNYIYKDENFEIFYEKNIKNFDYKDYYDAEVLTFYIIIDGTLFLENQILSKKDCFLTYQNLLSTPMTLISPEITILVIKIKNRFLNNMNINPTLEKRKFHIYSLEPFDFILKERGIEETNKFLVFKSAVYLTEYLKDNNFQFLDSTLLEYKEKILKVIEQTDEIEEEEIIKKFLAELDVGQSKLYRIFEDLFSTTPNKYIQDLKLRKAFRLLTETDIRIELIAEKLGYSGKVFSQRFFEKTGYLPSTFRKMMKNGE